MDATKPASSADPPPCFNAMRKALVRFLSRIVRDAATAEDLAQEALARLFQAQKAGNVIDPTAFAFRTAHNLAIDHLRQRRRRSFIEVSPDLASSDASPEEVAEARSAWRKFRAAIDAMPKLRRDIFVRRRLHGQSCEMIAAETGLNIRAIEKQISRALQTLAKTEEEAP